MSPKSRIQPEEELGLPGPPHAMPWAEVNVARRKLLELLQDQERPFLLETGEVNSAYLGFSEWRQQHFIPVPQHMEQGSRGGIFLLLQHKPSLFLSTVLS